MAYPYLDSFYTFDYISVLDNVIDPYPHTCTWISTSEAFTKWIVDDSTTFWLHGYPGLGKSVITKYLLKNAIDTPSLDNGSRPCILYFFCSYQLSSAQSYRGLICSLIHQLLTQRPDLAGYAVTLKNQFGFVKPDVDSLAGLQRIFKDLLYWYAHPKHNTIRYGSMENVPDLRIIIDGLDELDRSEWARFFETFGDVITGNKSFPRPKLKLLVTSRTEPGIEEHLIGVWDCNLGATNQNASDVAEYIRGTISDFGHRNNFGDENILEIVSEITKKAEGMFLWATLAWSLFTDGVGMWTRAVVQRKIQGLRQVPSGIESLYHRVLSLVDKRIATELLAALKWIVAAPEPLTVDEIAVALSLRARPRYKQQLDVPFNMQLFFKKSCPQLLKIDGSGAVKLVHLSFRSFLLDTETIEDGSKFVPNPFYFNLKHVNYDIGVDCLSYITLEDFSKETLDEARQHVFFSYCHKYWIHHLESLEYDFDDVFVYFFKLLNFETKKLRWYDTSKMLIQLWDRGLSKLFEPATRLGMDLNVLDDHGDHIIHHICNGPNGLAVDEKDLRRLVGLGLDLNGRTQMGQTLLHKCLEIWHDALCHPDLDIGTEADILAKTFQKAADTPKRPFEVALSLAKDTCKRLLLYPTIDLNATDKFWFSPLSYAIYWGLTDAMNMLLACPYLQAEKGHSALHIAAKEGLYDAVDRLLDRGTNVHGRNSQGQTALHLAAAGGHYRIMRLLVEHAGPELLNSKDRLIDPKDPYGNPRHWIGPNGWTPLHLAVTSGHDELVLWMINHPWINLHVKDKHGRAPIAFAAAFGTKTMLKAFLSRDPHQIAHKDLFGNGLVHMAIRGSNKHNFDYLFSLEVTPEFGPNKWGHTLADIAPTLALEQYMHELGFVHSKARKSSCRVVSIRYPQYTRVELEELELSGDWPPPPKGADSDLSLMYLPVVQHGFYWDYGLSAAERILRNILEGSHDRSREFNSVNQIIANLPVNIDGKEMSFAAYRNLYKSFNDDWQEEWAKNNLQRLKETFECLFEMNFERKEEWRGVKKTVDQLWAQSLGKLDA